MQVHPIINHATLPDMPSAANTDHDGRYYTEAEIDGFTIKYDSFAGDVYTLDTASIVLTGGSVTAANFLTAGDFLGSTFTGGTGSFANLTIATNLVHDGDTDTGVFFTTEHIELQADQTEIDGKLGVNVSSPTERAEFAEAITDLKLLFTTYSDGPVSKDSQFQCRRSHHDTLGTIATTLDGDYLGTWLFQGVDTTPAFDFGASIQVIQDGDAGARVPCKMLFRTTNTAFGINAGITLHADNSLRVTGNITIGSDNTPTNALSMDTAGKIDFRDNAIGIYSQADTFLDMFTDGGFRIGDSSAGAPTNYSQFAPDGILTMAGTARVKKEIIIGAGNFHKGSSAPGDGYVNAIVHTLDFDKTTTQHGHYNVIIPEDFATGTEISVEVDWFFDDVEAGHYMTWEMQYLLLADGEDPATAPTTIFQESVISTGNNDKQIHTIFGTGITGAVADDTLSIRISRDSDATNGRDDLNQDARLLVIHLHRIADKLGEAT